MTSLHNPYATLQSLQVSTSLDEYADPMEEASTPSSKESPKSSTEDNSPQSQQKWQQPNNETIEVEEDEPLPPLYHRTITEEQLRDDDRPYVFWASLWIPIPEKPDDPVNTMFEYLEQFITHMLDVDAHFSVFLHNLSAYKSLDDLPELIEDPDQLPADVDELEYFPGARPQACGGYTYTSVLIGMHEPFPKIIKATASWFRKTKFGLWKSSLQSEQPTLLGWLLFSTNTMDIEVL